MGLKLLAAPTSEPFTLADAKVHLREDDSSQDTLITALIGAARDYVETFTRRRLITQTWRYSIDEFPCGGVIRLPYPPLIKVNSVKYDDLAGAEQTLSSSLYVVDTSSLPGKIDRAYAAIWPATRCQANAVRIEFDCGFGGPQAVPDLIKAAMKLLIGHWYEQREAVNVGNIVTEIPLAVESMLWAWRVLEAA
jgi:uncharacterized phiE125 gp8 family phage protein